MPNKKNISNVKELTDKLSRAKSIYFTDYLGLNVSDVTSLRKKFFDSNVEYLVVKNTLLKIASDQNEITLGNELFSGSTAIAISYDEPVLAAKVIKDFLKDHDLPSIKGLLFEGSYLPASEFEKIANLPSKEESLTKIVVMLKSPVQNIVNLLNSPMVKLVNVLNGLKGTKN
ncbi:50S ribosomal protein L10 [bacterium]|nr:MAG: 50S ribosomal protein L10 [bacterium]